MTVTATKPGYKTTELILTVLTNLTLLIAAIGAYLPPKWAALASAVATGLYAISRGLAKLYLPPSVVSTPVTSTAPAATPPA